MRSAVSLGLAIATPRFEDGQEAVEAETKEEAKEESNETFDTPHDSDGDLTAPLLND